MLNKNKTITLRGFKVELDSSATKSCARIIGKIYPFADMFYTVGFSVSADMLSREGERPEVIVDFDIRTCGDTFKGFQALRMAGAIKLATELALQHSESMNAVNSINGAFSTFTGLIASGAYRECADLLKVSLLTKHLIPFKKATLIDALLLSDAMADVALHMLNSTDNDDLYALIGELANKLDLIKTDSNEIQLSRRQDAFTAVYNKIQELK